MHTTKTTHDHDDVGRADRATLAPARAAALPTPTALLLQMQDSVGNGAVSRSVNRGHVPATESRARSTAGAEGGVAQRMVAISKNATTNDFVEQTSIHYALKRAGGPVGLLAAMDFSTLEFGDQLYIVAHGAPGSSGDYSTAQIVGALTDPVTGIKNGGINIVFTSCNAGTEEHSGWDDSLVAGVSQALTARHLPNFVAGATGNSIKHDEVQGGAFTAIQKALVGQARISQATEKAIHQPQQKFDLWLSQNPKATDEEKAAQASAISKPFFEAFVLDIRAKNLHIDDAHAIDTRVGWG